MTDPEQMRTFPVEIESDLLWSLFKSTVPDSTTIQSVFQEFVRERVREQLSEEFIQSAPKFTDEHLEYFREEIVRDGEDE